MSLLVSAVKSFNSFVIFSFQRFQCFQKKTVMGKSINLQIKHVGVNFLCRKYVFVKIEKKKSNFF